MLFLLLLLGAGVYCLYKGAKLVFILLILWLLFSGGCHRRYRHEPEIPAAMHRVAPLPLVEPDYFRAMAASEISHDQGW